jgi:hypothetical protein
MLIYNEIAPELCKLEAINVSDIKIYGGDFFNLARKTRSSPLFCGPKFRENYKLNMNLNVKKHSHSVPIK